VRLRLYVQALTLVVYIKGLGHTSIRKVPTDSAIWSTRSRSKEIARQECIGLQRERSRFPEGVVEFKKLSYQPKLPNDSWLELEGAAIAWPLLWVLSLGNAPSPLTRTTPDRLARTVQLSTLFAQVLTPSQFFLPFFAVYMYNEELKIYPCAHRQSLP
jgi:hypothetical protein